MAASTFIQKWNVSTFDLQKIYYKAGDTKTKYREYIIKLTCSYFNRKWNFAQIFL